MGWLTLEEDHPLEKQQIEFMLLGKVIHYIKMPLSGEGNLSPEGRKCYLCF